MSLRILNDLQAFVPRAASAEQLARHLFFRHDPTWRDYVTQARRDAWGSKSPIRKPEELFDYLLSALTAEDFRPSGALEPETQALLRDTIGQGLGETSWELEEHRALTEMRTILGARRIPRAQKLTDLVTAAAPWAKEAGGLIASFDAQNGLLFQRVQHAAGVFSAGRDSYATHLAHFLVGTDMHGPPVQVQTGYSPFGEPMVTINLTAARLLRSTMRPAAFDDMREPAERVLGKVVKTSNLRAAGKAWAVMLVHRRMLRRARNATLQDAAHRWNDSVWSAKAGPQWEVPVEHVVRSIRRHGEPIIRLVLRARLLRP